MRGRGEPSYSEAIGSCATSAACGSRSLSGAAVGAKVSRELASTSANAKASIEVNG